MREIEAARREAEYARQQARLAKESRFIERFKTHVAKAAQVQSRLKKLDKVEKIAEPRRIRREALRVPHAGALGRRRGQARAALRKAYGARVVHAGLTLTVRRKERWAVMGENGAGKSTLLKMIAGALAPDDGEAAIGASVALGYYAQHVMDLLSGDRTILEELTRARAAGQPGHAAQPGRRVRVPRRRRVQAGARAVGRREGAARAGQAACTTRPNLLVLDEPTNHLDIATKRALVTALADYEGTLVFVSHDRQFLRALANRVLELSAAGPRIYGGSYDEYVSSTGREAPGMRA